MEFTRRRLLAALPGAALPIPPRDRPALRLIPDQEGSAILRSDAPPGQIRLPGLRARPATPAAFAAGKLAAFVYAAEDQTGTLEVLALAGWTGAGLCLLALEPLSWRGPRSSLHTRAHPAGDGARLELRRDAALRRDGMWRHESWTDYLAWSPAALTDSPARPPPADSLQARLARRRLPVLAWLQVPRDDAWLAPELRDPLA